MDSTTERIDQLPPKAKDYLRDVLSLIDSKNSSAVSIIIFGTAISGGFSNAVSDVDIIIVLADHVPKKIKRILDEELHSLEYAHGFRRHAKSLIETLNKYANELAGMYLSHFVCYRHELLTGNSARVLNLLPVLSVFTSATRIPFANIVLSGKTIWGEDLLQHVNILPIRRSHLLIGCALYLSTVFGAILWFPILQDPTKVAMVYLKWSLHSCYFCYNLKAATMQQEIEYFTAKLGEQTAFRELTSLRQAGRRSFGFVTKCFSMILKLYTQTLRDVTFPISVHRE